jgi:hypothetical protein
MAEFDIQYKVTADTSQAKQALSDIDNQVNGLQQAASTTAPAMDKLDEAIAAYRNKGKEAVETTEELGMSTLSMGTIFAGAATGGVYLLGNALYDLVKNYLAVDTSIENLTKKLKDHWSEVFRANQEWEKFNNEIKKFSTAEIIESIAALDRELTKTGNKLLTNPLIQIRELFTGDYTSYMQSLLEQVKMLNKELYGSPETLGFEDVPKDMQKKWKDSFKTIKSEADNFYDHLKKLEKDYMKWLVGGINDRAEFYKEFAQSGMQVNRGKSAGGFSPSSTGMAVGAFSKGYADNLKLITELTVTAADTLQSEFSSAWQDIFGEANSLFEKLLMNIADKLAERGIESLFGSLLNFIVPGLGTAAGMAGSNSPSIINLNMDNRTVAQFYVNGKNQAGRLRMAG